VLLMPLLLPLADLVGVTRQVAVTAYCFGDGFSNLAYPTNPVLLIVLGLANLRYSRWMRWTAPLWAVVLPVTLVFLWWRWCSIWGRFRLGMIQWGDSHDGKESCGMTLDDGCWACAAGFAAGGLCGRGFAPPHTGGCPPHTGG
jgi:hypothetical protein